MTRSLAIRTSSPRGRAWIFAALLAIASAGRFSFGQSASDIKWTKGPATVSLGDVANLNLPAGYRFTDALGAQIFMDLTHNLYSSQLGVVIPDDIAKDDWFILFNYDDIGYVKDSEKLDSKTADTILNSIKENTEKSNQEKIARGWETMQIDGWSQSPFYDNITHSLTWAILAASNNHQIVNYDARVLGRRGVLRVKMVLPPELLQATVPKFQGIVKAVAFNQGQTYSEFRTGDRVAKYGLVGLMTGVGAVAAIKFWKPLLAFGAAIVAGIGTMIKKVKNFITGKRA